MKKIFVLSLLMFAFVLKGTASEHSVGAGVTADKAIVRLQEGNKRFVAMKMKHPDESKKRRAEMKKGQHPFVVILSCSDSRVPLELIFDQGLGDIFEIRNAGNVLDDHVIGSIEYAVMHCGVKLIVIMGHQDCGAIAATLCGESETKYIQSLETSIQPAVEQCKRNNLEINSDNVVKAHVAQDIDELMSQDEALVNYMKSNGVKIVPAYYSIETGEVEFLK